MLSSFLLTALAALSADAFAIDSHSKYHYKRDAGDLRSPCPAVNTMANHGFINRNGRNVNLNDLSLAAQNVWGLDANVANVLTHVGWFATANTTLDGLLRQNIDLTELRAHGGVEHDASLTRLDFVQGDNHSLQPHLLAAMMEDSPDEFITMDSLAKTRARVEQDSIKRGQPELSLKGNFISYGEAALVLQTMNAGTDMANAKARKSDIETWFGQERLPDGFKPPNPRLDVQTVLGMMAKLTVKAKLLQQ